MDCHSLLTISSPEYDRFFSYCANNRFIDYCDRPTYSSSKTSLVIICQKGASFVSEGRVSDFTPVPILWPEWEISIVKTYEPEDFFPFTAKDTVGRV